MVTLVHLEDLPVIHADLGSRATSIVADAKSVPGATVESVQPIINEIIHVYGQSYDPPSSPTRNTERVLPAFTTQTPGWRASPPLPVRNNAHSLPLALAQQSGGRASPQRCARNYERALPVAPTQTSGGRASPLRTARNFNHTLPVASEQISGGLASPSESNSFPQFSEAISEAAARSVAPAQSSNPFQNLHNYHQACVNLQEYAEQWASSAAFNEELHPYPPRENLIPLRFSSNAIKSFVSNRTRSSTSIKTKNRIATLPDSTFFRNWTNTESGGGSFLARKDTTSAVLA